MTNDKMPHELITRRELAAYKLDIMEKSVLVTVETAAEILSCRPRTVYSLVQEGRISGYNRGGRTKGLRILAAELRDYVASIKIDRDDFRL
jgi:excisionase family DNA binding protein